MQSVGVTRQLRRYSVKSMRGESLEATRLTLQGVPADRATRLFKRIRAVPFPGSLPGNYLNCFAIAPSLRKLVLRKLR
jgi:hypothetical protein